MFFSSLFTPYKKVITHSSRFHADDLFGVATLSIVFSGKISVTRTRDESKFGEADIILDIGGENDPARDKFDHHQKGGAGARPSGIPYASFGLIWKKYGVQAIKSAVIDAGRKVPSEEILKAVAEKIDERLVAGVDATDNGIEILKAIDGVNPYEFDDIASLYRPTWQEKGKDFDDGFFEALPIFISILHRQIIMSVASEEAKGIVEKKYAASPDKRLLVLDEDYPSGFLADKNPELLYTVHENTVDKTWVVLGARIAQNEFPIRKKFPAAWAGLRDADLAKVTGVPDAAFCHNGRFIAVARSRAGALKLAELALAAPIE